MQWELRTEQAAASRSSAKTRGKMRGGGRPKLPQQNLKMPESYTKTQTKQPPRFAKLLM
jgi:hypothetical protein